MKKAFLILTLFCTALVTQAQQHVVDSLQVELRKAQTDSARVMLNSQLCEQYFRFDLEKALLHGKAAEKLAEEIKFTRGHAKALNALGITYLIKSDYDKALDAHFKALRLREQLKDTAAIIASYTNLGNVYYKSLDPKRAVSTYKSAVALAHKINDKLGLSRLYNNMGSFSQGAGNLKEALSYFEKAARLKLELNDKPGYAVTLHHMGTIQLKQDKPKEALPHLFKAKKLNEELQNEYGNLNVYRALAEAYLALDDLNEALKYASWSYEKSKESKSNNEISVSADQMRAIALRMQDHQKAYQYLEIGAAAGDSMHNENTQRIREEMTARFETEKKELANQRLLLEKEQQDALIQQKERIEWLGAAVIALLAALLVGFYMSRKRVKSINCQLMLTNQEVQLKNERIAALVGKLTAQNTQLEQSGGFKNKVLSIISHDLRNPFASMKGLFQVASRKQLSDAEVKRIFALLDKEADVAMSMLNNLLIWAKSQMDGSEVSLQATDVQELVAENMLLVTNQAAQKDITLVNLVADCTQALADKERLNFVLRNLLMNALKFSYEGGVVSVHTSEQDGQLVIAVQDSGKGIAPEHLPKLFSEERFTTLGTAKEKGTGLGLMLCKEFMSSIQGRIWVESEEGKGSTFYVMLPLAARNAVLQAEELAEAV